MAKSDKVGKETVKRKRIIMLPEVKNYIIQPNRITNAVYNYTLIQEKIFTAIMFYLQEPINLSMKNVNIHQLDLFTKSEKVRLTIPLREIAKPRQYGEVKEAMQQMAGIVINIPYLDANEKKRKKITNLFNFDVPEQAEYQSSVIIEMEKMVAEILIDIDKDPTNQRPINYTLPLNFRAFKHTFNAYDISISKFIIITQYALYISRFLAIFFCKFRCDYFER
ncbi:RepB family plasmid replication initiator protein [bacterium]|nr:MAG: RepB family plasmid replication initiator protein [bacterium]